MTPPRGRAGRARPGGPTRGGSSSSPCLPFRWCRLIHAVEVAFESIYMSGPEPTERSEPGIQLLQGLWLQAVEPALCVHRGFHETGLAQHAQVLGDRGLRHPQSALDLSHRLLGRDQEAQDRPAVRLRNDCERRFHRSEEHTSELQSRLHLVCRLLLEKKKRNTDAQWFKHNKCASHNPSYA